LILFWQKSKQSDKNEGKDKHEQKRHDASAIYGVCLRSVLDRLLEITHLTGPRTCIRLAEPWGTD
jgi:hypothetical protein